MDRDNSKSSSGKKQNTATFLGAFKQNSDEISVNGLGIKEIEAQIDAIIRATDNGARMPAHIRQAAIAAIQPGGELAWVLLAKYSLGEVDAKYDFWNGQLVWSSNESN